MNFKEALLLASKYVSSRPSHPVLGCLAIKDNTMIAYDLMTAIAVPLSEVIPDICVPAEVVKKLLKKFKNDFDVFVDKDKRDRLSLTIQEQSRNKCFGSSRQSIDGLPIEEYPELPTVETGNSILVNESDLAQAFKQLKPSLSKDETRRILTGLNIKISNGKAIATATDGHTASQTSFDVEGDREWNITIPPKFFDILDVKSDRQIELYHDDYTICLAIGNIKVYQKLLDGNYPNIPDLSRQSFACIDHNFRSGLLDNLAIAKAYGSEWVDLHIVHDPKTKSQGELIVAMETTDSLRHNFTIPTPSPMWLAFFGLIMGEYNTVIKELRLSYSDRSLVADLHYEYVTGAMDYCLPVQAMESKSIKVNIKLLEAQLKAMPKDRDIMINLKNESDFARNAIVLSSLGTSLVSVVTTRKDAPKPLIEDVVLTENEVAIAEPRIDTIEPIKEVKVMSKVVAFSRDRPKDNVVDLEPKRGTVEVINPEQFDLPKFEFWQPPATILKVAKPIVRDPNVRISTGYKLPDKEKVRELVDAWK